MRRILLLCIFVLTAAASAAQTVQATLPADGPRTIALCGDIMMGTTYPTVRLPEKDGADIFADVKQLFLDADFSAGNLEGVICEGGSCTKNTGKANNYAFRMPESYVHLLTDAGFDYLNLANNHTNDFGSYGLERTREVLEREGIAYSGLPDCESVVVEKDGVRYGVCSFGHNSYTLKHTDTASVTRIVTALRPKCDILIVTFHGGAEGSKYSHLPDGPETYLGENRGNLRAFAHHCIDLGADLVFGHGPHVTRAVECYNDRLIAYSLGNFCFGGNTDPDDKDTMIFQQTFTFVNGELQPDDYIKIIPASVSGVSYCNNYQPVVLEGSEKERVMRKIMRFSSGFEYRE